MRRRLVPRQAGGTPKTFLQAGVAIYRPLTYPYTKYFLSPGLDWVGLVVGNWYSLAPGKGLCKFIIFGVLGIGMNEMKKVKVSQMRFDEAMKLLERGACVSRGYWGEDCFLFMIGGSNITGEDLVYKQPMVPRSVKQYYLSKFNEDIGKVNVTCAPYIAFHKKVGVIVNGWKPGLEDIEASDWVVISL